MYLHLPQTASAEASLASAIVLTAHFFEQKCSEPMLSFMQMTSVRSGFLHVPHFFPPMPIFPQLEQKMAILITAMWSVIAYGMPHGLPNESKKEGQTHFALLALCRPLVHPPVRVDAFVLCMLMRLMAVMGMLLCLFHHFITR